MDPSTAVPVFGSARAGLRLELVLASASLEELEDPFVPLSDAGRYSRVLLGRITLGQNTPLRQLAIKIQRSSYRPAAATVGQAPVTNATIDELWRRERAALLKTTSPEILGLLDLGDEFSRNRPTLFCKSSRRYFHPFCPTCFAFLEDCRDDAYLHDLGLPTYGNSTVRYLYCATCKSGTFYTHALSPEEQPRANVRIRRRSDLYADLVKAAANAPADRRARLEEVFPCHACGHTADAIAKAIVPVSFYEFHMLPLEPLPLHYDEWSDLIGGAPWPEIKKHATEIAGATGREILLKALDPSFSSPFQWVFKGDGAGRYPLEVLRLKMIAFTQICRGLKTYHTTLKQPHLDLNPTSVMMDVQPMGEGLPSLWNIRAKLLDLASPHRFRTATATPEFISELLLPAPDVPKAYLSPIVRQAEQGHEETERITVREIKIEATDARFELETVSSKARLREYHPRDLVRIVPATALSWLENASLWGTITDVAERGFRISAVLPNAHKGLSALRLPVTLEAGVSLYKRFHVPCDLYSLGMLLLRSLLVHDGQDIGTVEDILQRVLQKLSVSLEDVGSNDARRISTQVQWQIEAEPDVFSKSNVLYTRAERQQKVNAIPQRLWTDILLFAFRLLTNMAGFSFAQHHGDYPPNNPEAVLDEVLLELASLNTRLHVELFASADRNRVLSEACDELIAELTGPSIPFPPGETA